jgi:hypothetical protein
MQARLSLTTTVAVAPALGTHHYVLTPVEPVIKKKDLSRG